MLKMNIANKIYSMHMVFAIDGRLGRITCTNICQFLLPDLLDQHIIDYIDGL